MSLTDVERWAGRAAYTVAQTGRVAWYLGHGAATLRMARRLNAEAGTRRLAPKPSRPVPGARRLLADVAALLARDLGNAEAGLYPLPENEDGSLAGLLARSRDYFRDVPQVMRRRRSAATAEVAGSGASRPDYYLQNFHFQSGGWLTEESARLYDMQVEVLFYGAANAMRRQALVPMGNALRGRDQRRLAYADIACGPGGFLRQVRQAFPRLPALGIDLSEPYAAEARRRLGSRPHAGAIVAKAEALPLAASSLDIATSIFLFHELPPQVRRAVAREVGRVMKPGGLFVFVESLQPGDDPDYDGLLEVFPALFHEPYFESYLGEDLAALFGAEGLMLESTTNAFLSKVLALRKV